MRIKNNILNAKTVGFGAAVAIAILFNTVLAIAKDAHEPLLKFMVSLSGHHWTTHGIIDILIFLVFGYLLSKSNFIHRFNCNKLSRIIYASTVISVIGLVGWFFFA